MTKVVNIKRLSKWWQQDDQYVYIGRAGKGLTGEFGNPILLERESDRLKVLDAYRTYLEDRISRDEDFRAKVKALSGKTLVCFCRPAGGFKGRVLCHGQILAAYIDGIKPEEVE